MTDDFLDRFSGKGVPRIGGPPVANPRLRDPVGLQCLWDGPLALDANEVQKALRDYHPEMAEATAELLEVPPPEKTPPHGIEPTLLGLLAWDRHVVKLVGFNTPMPAEAVEACVRPAHFAAEYKARAYQHQSHVMLYYVGYDHDPLEQYVAVAACAGAIAYFGASFVLNETGHTAVPAAVLHPHEEDAGDILRALRNFPLPFLYCGFVKLEVEGVPGVWMRTYGCHRFGLPDLAFHAPGHEYGATTFELFGNLLAYLQRTGHHFAPGHTFQIDDTTFFRLRARTLEEWYLASEGSMLIAERIRPEEANR
ncbi:MAG: DUF4261 domain-containing protein [Gemmataceae bacterium]|nr:DUF4261 domain-containing protein [Gemmata sp.]MDW8198919.1 DUF4261 domain-containing protein [Gemmataceae bacterium]